MKWLVVLLLAFNVLAFTWQYQQKIAADARHYLQHEPLPEGTPGLVLLTEQGRISGSARNPGADGVEASAPSAAGTDGNLRQCIELGPVEDLTILNRAVDALGAEPDDVRQRTEAVEVKRLFWVYLEPESSDMAQRQLSSLQADGVTDYLMVRRGELENAISLGLFRSQESVSRRLAELTEKGYRPVVIPRIQTRDEYSMTVLLPQGSEALSAASVLAASGLQDIAIRSSSCAAFAAASDDSATMPPG